MVNIDLIKIPKIKLCGNVIGVRANLIKIWKCRCFCQLCVISQVCLSFTGFMVIKFGNYAYTQFIFLGIVFSGIVFSRKTCFSLICFTILFSHVYSCEACNAFLFLCTQKKRAAWTRAMVGSAPVCAFGLLITTAMAAAATLSQNKKGGDDAYLCSTFILRALINMETSWE